ncbi:MAG: SIR2 family protein [Desulfobacter sp.]|nr:MAG: SIR2 family protein [Desulfobacter sp.]
MNDPIVFNKNDINVLMEVCGNLESDETTALFIGPNIIRTNNNKSLYQGLRSYLKESAYEMEYDAYNHLICDKRTKCSIYHLVKKYYTHELQMNPIYEQIARIPFHIIISITPDLLLKNAFEKQGIPYEFSYYTKGKPSKEVKDPSKETPLIYNLFGSIENRESLILTQDDILDFLFSIIGEHDLPMNLKETIKDVTHYIFLGFDFKQWYLKILLRLFDLSRDKVSISPDCELGNYDNVFYQWLHKSKIHRIFYENTYKMTFIPTHTEAYIAKLKEMCEEQGLLREVHLQNEISEEELQKDRLIKLVMRNQIGGAIDMLIEIFKEERQINAYTDMVAQSGRFNGLKDDYRRGALSRENFDIEVIKIREHLMDVINGL